MKPSAFLILLLLIPACRLFSQQPYNPFIKEGAHWEIDNAECDYTGMCDPGTPATDYIDVYHYFFKLEGDTLIASFQYKKMYEAYWAECANCNNPHIPNGRGSAPYSLYALLWEDTLAKKVYWKPATAICDTDSLFFDFSPLPGDTVTRTEFDITGAPYSWGQYCGTDKFKIDSANYSGFDSFQVSTSYYNGGGAFTQGFFGDIPLTAFEGIGLSNGFTILPGVGGDCACYRSTLISYCIGNDSVCAIDFPTSVARPQVPVARLYPNPASTYIRVESPDGAITELDIFNAEGQKISVGYQPEADISRLSAGIYFMKIITKQGSGYQKFIKQ